MAEPGPPVAYAEYLGLEALLVLPRPLSPPHDPDTWLDERFFVVTHQVSELWLSQVAADLTRARTLAECGDWTSAATLVARATATVLLLVHHLTHLAHLPRESFLCFRPLLGSASGAQSEQACALLLEEAHPAVVALRAAARTDLGTAEARHALDTEVDALVAEIRGWRAMHRHVAWTFIGGRHGTGGTSGVAYLARATAEEAPAPPPPPDLADEVGPDAVAASRRTG